MKFVVIFFAACVATLSSPVLGAITHHPPNPLRRDGGCYEADVGHLLAGESVPVPGKCEAANCLIGGAVTYYSCESIVITNPDCRKTPVDLTKVYPVCCPKATC